MKPNIQIWAVDRLVPYSKNVKIHDEGQVKRIAQSIREFGWTQPIVVDIHGSIIAGHGRRLAAISLGMTEVPVWVRDDLDEAQVRALRLADNRVAEGQIDTMLFRKELEDLDFDLTGIFDAKELEFSIADLGDLDTSAFVPDLDAAVAEQSEATKQRASEVLAKPVALTKLFGFDKVQGTNQLAVQRLIAFIEHKTGKKGEDALVAFAEGVGHE
jgi:ParB/RepB/Spo0J family partition protein